MNSLVCGVLAELLEKADLPAWSAGIATLRSGLVQILAAAGLHADPSDASFVLVRDAAGVRDHLAAQAVLVRDTASFGIPEGVRIAVPDAVGLDRVRVRAPGPAVLTAPVVSTLAAAYDVVLLDIGDTLVAEAAAGTPTAHLVAQPLPGVLDTLNALRGRVRLGAVTNTSIMREVEVRSILESVGLGDLLEVVVTSTDVGVAKPDPLPVKVALDRMTSHARPRALRRGPRDRP